MSLSVADIDRWTADSVREVFRAAGQRAQITENVSRELAALSVFQNWEGEAADAARHAVATTRRDLDAHGNEAASVASAAARAADGIDKVKADLQAVRAEAESHGLEIDPVSGAVMPARATAPAVISAVCSIFGRMPALITAVRVSSATRINPCAEASATSS